MSSTSFTKVSSSAIHISLLVVSLAVTAAIAAAGCTAEEWGGGGEGDRCNPDLSHDECGSGLACTQPALCPENYCCPTSGQSSNGYCQTGCNGGALSICMATTAAGNPDPNACAFAYPDAGFGTED
jgi:hypothetical protein